MMKKFYGIFLGILMTIALCGCGQETVTTQEKSWEEQLNLGNRYTEEMDYEAAIAAYTAAIEIDPNQPKVYVARGNAYLLSGESEDNLALAQEDFEMAINLDEMSVDAYLGLADVYEWLGDYESSIAILEQGIDVTQDEMLTEKLDSILKNGGVVSEQKGDSTYFDDGSYPVLVLGDDIKTQFDSIIQHCLNENYWEAINVLWSNEFFLMAEECASQRDPSREMHEGVFYSTNSTELYLKTEYKDYHIYLEIGKAQKGEAGHATSVILPENGRGVMISSTVFIKGSDYYAHTGDGIESSSGKGYLVCETVDYQFNGFYSIYGETTTNRYEEEALLYIYQESGMLKNNFYDGTINVTTRYATDTNESIYQYIYDTGLLVPQGVDENGRVNTGYGYVENMDVFEEYYSEPEGPIQAIDGYSNFTKKAPWE